MTAPLDGPAALLGLSPWILPLIAVAAKRREEPPRTAGRVLLAWWRGLRDARPDDRRRLKRQSTSAPRRVSKP